jgi:hypothetical protein
MEMRIIMKSVILNNRAEIMVDVSGPPGQGEFHCVYHYLKKFVIKMAVEIIVLLDKIQQQTDN